MLPKVSVIIPIYNVEPYLDRCIQSVRNQTLKDIEIILVDDGSPDNCPAMCDEYARQDNRIKVIHKKNAGLGYARNSGLDIATGEYVAFLDSDDFVDVVMYEELYKTAKEFGLDTCYCSFNYYQANKVIPRNEVVQFELFQGQGAVKKFLLDMVGPDPSYPHEVKYLMCVWKAIYSLNLIKRFNLRFDSEKELASEDILFHSIYLPKATNVGFVPDCLYYYCENGSSISKTYSDTKFQLIRNSLMEVKKRLEQVYSREDYLTHYQRYLFLSLRGVLWHEMFNTCHSFNEKCSAIRLKCSDEAYSLLFQEYPYRMLPFAKRIFYKAAQKKNVIAIMCFLYFMKICR